MATKDLLMARDWTAVSLGALINDVARSFNRLFDIRVSTMDLTRGQWKVLLHLKRREGLNQSELKELLEVSPPALAKVLDHLEAKGWLERRTDTADRRTNRLYLTKKIEPLLSKVHEIATQNDRHAFEGLSKDEAAELIRLLLKVKKNFSEHDQFKNTRRQIA
jgi:MarR family transcriptional regulator, transcriptional regulator for hemolysin